MEKMCITLLSAPISHYNQNNHIKSHYDDMLHSYCAVDGFVTYRHNSTHYLLPLSHIN